VLIPILWKRKIVGLRLTSPAGEWSDARKRDDDRQIITEAWINGFLTASGHYRTNTDAIRHPDLIVGIDYYCRSNPDIPLSTAVRKQLKQ
jgi:hypothetical protein